MKVRMTKKRSKALDIGISLDDLLYEKFRLLNQQLNERIERYYRQPQRVIKVLQKDASGNYLVLPMLDVHVCDIGTEVIVGGFHDGKKK